MSKKIKVVELFAGVGGFRLGLEAAPTTAKRRKYDVVWSNQWEPSTKKQHASAVYQARWPKCAHVNANIETVVESDFQVIPDHDLLVGGFPCQDYSVAASLRTSKGLRGKKGVLWWSIEAILRKKGKAAPSYLMLENVDRLLQSPAGQRGRDFAIMLKSLDELNYAVEWRVINAADYGMPQRRRRVFIMAFRKGTAQYKRMKSANKATYLSESGLIQNAFPANLKGAVVSGELKGDIVSISKDFNTEGACSPFLTSGLMVDGVYHSAKTEARYTGKRILLEDVLLPLNEVDTSFYIAANQIAAWQYQKGGKKLQRTSREGHSYTFSEGAMSFPDAKDRPSRTIVTGEGGPSASRFKHVVEQEGQLRRLTPLELERLNMFPDEHTALSGITDSKRAFFMGNALVVGVVKILGKALAKAHYNEQ